MRKVTETRMIFEVGDVIELTGDARPNEAIRKDVKSITAMLVKTEGKTWSKRAVTSEGKVITLNEEQLRKARYIGSIDLSMLIGKD